MFRVNNTTKVTVSLIGIVFLMAFLWAPVIGAKSSLLLMLFSIGMYAAFDYYYTKTLNPKGYLAYALASIVGVAISLYLYCIF